MIINNKNNMKKTPQRNNYEIKINNLNKNNKKKYSYNSSFFNNDNYLKNKNNYFSAFKNQNSLFNEQKNNEIIINNFEKTIKNDENNAINQEKTQENQKITENLIKLQDKNNELEKRIKSMENNSGNVDLSDIENDIQTNASNITSLQSSISGQASSLNTLSNSVQSLSSQVSGFNSSITANSNNISLLTTSVNSCIQAINEINNGAELPTPLFTISGVSFGTPVYSVYDDLDYEHCFLFKNQNYNRNIWFICEPYTPLHFKLSIQIQVPSSNTARNLIIEINGDIIKKVNYSNTTAGTYTIETEFNYYTNTKSNALKFYVDSNLTEVHLHTLFQLWGKNVCFLNSKRKFNIAPCVDGNYLFSRTLNGYPQYQLATYENLDFENGWQYVPNYQNFYGAQHHYLQLYETTNNVSSLINDFLIYENYNNSQKVTVYDSSINYRSTMSKGQFLQSATIQQNYDNHNFAIPVVVSGNKNACSYYYNITNKYFVEININDIYNLNNILPTSEIVDANICINLENSYTTFLSNIAVIVDNNGQVFLSAFHRSKVYNIFVGYGTQPTCFFDDNNVNILYVYINNFGTLIKYTYEIGTKAVSLVEKNAINLGEVILKGYNNSYFLQQNNQIKK